MPGQGIHLNPWPARNGAPAPSCNLRISNFSKKKKKKKYIYIYISNFGPKKIKKFIPTYAVENSFYNFSLKNNVECHVGLLYVYKLHQLSLS